MNTMDLRLPTPSLQHLALVKLGVHLWSQPEILSRIKRANFRDFMMFPASDEETEAWREIEERVKEKVLAVPLPQLLKNPLLGLIKPLGFEIHDWCVCYQAEIVDEQVCPKKLSELICWTMRGTVDHKQTAELLAKDESTDIAQRYKIACAYCLENEISALRKRMSEREMSEILRKTYRANMPMNSAQHLIFFWTCTLDVNWRDQYFLKEDTLDFAYAYKCATSSNSDRVACVYFFKKLNHLEQRKVLWEFKCRPQVFPTVHTTVLFELLPEMSEEQREYIFSKCSIKILIRLLNWPRQALFTKTSKRVWARAEISQTLYQYFLHLMVEKIRRGFTDYNYAQLFWEFWIPSSEYYKRKFLGNGFNFDFIKELFETRNEEIMKFVLDRAPPHLVSRLVFDEKDQVREFLTDESVVSDATLKACSRLIELDSGNVEREEENRLRRQNLLRISESRTQKKKSLSSI